MRTITLKNLAPRSSFVKVAEFARNEARRERAIVRFAMGPANARQTFVASPNKPLATLIWEWSKSPAGLAPKRAPRKAKTVSPGIIAIGDFSR